MGSRFLSRALDALTKFLETDTQGAAGTAAQVLLSRAFVDHAMVTQLTECVDVIGLELALLILDAQVVTVADMVGDEKHGSVLANAEVVVHVRTDQRHAHMGLTAFVELGQDLGQFLALSWNYRLELVPANLMDPAALFNIG